MKIRMKIADRSWRKKRSKISKEENRNESDDLLFLVKLADDIKENETQGKAIGSSCRCCGFAF